MLIYGRQRRHRFYYRHLISPTRHGCTTHSEMRYLQVELVTKSILSIHSVSVMTQIFFIDCQQHWKYDRTMNTGANAHGKRAVSTLEIATSDRLDLRWQLGFQWHGIGIEIVLQVPRLFHNATVSQCDHFLLLHMYMYLLFETSPGWRGFFKLNFVGATELQCIYYLCRILISRPPRVFRRFKRRSCLCCNPKHTIEQIIKLPVNCDAMILMWGHSNDTSLTCNIRTNVGWNPAFYDKSWHCHNPNRIMTK